FKHAGLRWQTKKMFLAPAYRLAKITAAMRQMSMQHKAVANSFEDFLKQLEDQKESSNAQIHNILDPKDLRFHPILSMLTYHLPSLKMQLLTTERLEVLQKLLPQSLTH
ncbi:MAG: hypothetical protein V4495_29805, partial [Pseudomonadota bacterium]